MTDTFFIDGKEIPFNKDEPILEAALRAGYFIPHYCYHSGLSVAATCRMCMIEVIDAGNGKPLPKLQTSCSTKALANMKVVTNSKNVSEARKWVMEFLLLNHPLDCTICDQSGECDLQDFSYEYGTGVSHFNNEKRVYGVRNIGTFLELERNRCIHCTRCVRFSQEITETSELGTFGRTHQLTVDTFIDNNLSDKFQGNLADICPVGAITLKDFRFRKRAWKLTKVPSVCDQCSTGCNVYLWNEKGILHRIKPRENQEVNKWWMCDYGRVNFHEHYSPKKRLSTTLVLGELQTKENALFDLADDLQQNTDNFLILNSGHSTLEEALSAKMFAELVSSTPALYAPAPPPEHKPSERWIDNLISNDKTPNLAGLKLLGYKITELDDFRKNIDQLNPNKPKIVLVIGRLPQKWQEFLTSNANIRIYEISCLKNEHLTNCRANLPTIAFFEKSGIFVNRFLHAQRINPIKFGEKEIFEECSLWSNLAKKIDISYHLPDNPSEFLDKLVSSSVWESLKVKPEVRPTIQSSEDIKLKVLG